MTDGPVMAIHDWKTNGHLIADCARLGYLRKEWVTLDPTFGVGTFWTVWRPDLLIASDVDPRKSPWGKAIDFTELPWSDGAFDAVVFDPPYKLNGTDQGEGERYGVHTPLDWRERMYMIRDGLAECVRVLGDGYLLLKCQDQVCRGKVRWQTIDFTNYAADLGLGLVDRFDFLSYRPQPAGRRQIHARRNSSTLLVLKRGA